MSEARDPNGETVAEGPARQPATAATLALGAVAGPAPTQVDPDEVGPPRPVLAETVATPGDDPFSTIASGVQAPAETVATAVQDPYSTIASGIADPMATRALADTEAGATVALDRGGVETENVTNAWAGDETGVLPVADTEKERAGQRPGRPGIGVLAVVPGYEMIAEIGRGGMGVVYKARQIRLDRLVALKMVLAGAHASGEMLERFHIEAQAVAQLQHPGIVQIHEVGDHDGLPYFSLEFVAGGSLSQKLAGKPQLPREAAAMVRDLALAMHEAHSRGIIHRDLKPANVLLTVEGKPKITDFGLAKRMEADSGQTRSGAIMGTPSYMAPEQAWGKTHEIGPLSDQYALGAILYEMLVGRPPFQGSTVFETLELARTQEPVPPRRLQPKIPADLETICLKCLQKDQGKRFADDQALADDLGRFLDGQPILARPVGAPERFVRWCRRNPRVAGLAATVLALLVTVTAVSSAAAVTLQNLNGQLEKSVESEKAAKTTAQEEEAAAVLAKEQADRARDKEREARKLAEDARKLADEARDKERLARVEKEKSYEKRDKAVLAAFNQNRAAIESWRYNSVLINQRLRMFPGTQELREEMAISSAKGLDEVVKVMEQLAEVVRDQQGEYAAIKALAGINQRAGKVVDELGRYDEAARYFRRMDELAQRLAKSSPPTADLLSVLSASEITLGEFAMDRQMDSGSAIAHYGKCLDHRRQLLALQPNDDGAKRSVCNALGALARAYLKIGDAAKARDAYAEEAKLRDRFGPATATKLEVRRERSGLEEKLGDLAVALGDTAAGKAHYEHSLELREAIAAEHPEESQARRDALLSMEKLGTLAMIQLNDPSAARAWYEKARPEYEERRRRDAQANFAREDVARIEYHLGTACRRLGDREASDAHFRACLAIREQAGPEPKVKQEAVNLMLARARCGQHERAAKLAAGLLDQPPVDALMAYNVACAYALCAGGVAEGPGSKELTRRYVEEALKALRLAATKGWKGWSEIRTDPDLDPIRDEPGLIAIADEIRKAEKP